MVLKRQCHQVYKDNPSRQQDTRRLSKQQRRTQEAHRATPVHRRTRHIEREPSDHLIHEDAEVVAQEGACDTEGPGGGDDEDVAARDEGVGGGLDGEGEEERVGTLLGDGGLEEVVAEDAEGEDGGGEGVAGGDGAPSEEVGEDLVVVLCRWC